MLSDKVMLVSGTGPGLGREIAVRGAAAGADVVLAARTEKVLRSVAAEVEALGRRALVVPADILDPDACRGLTDRALEAFGRVDVFVSNAFVPPAMGDLATMDVDAVRASLETDALAALRLVQLLTPTLTEHAGSVVMVSSAVVHHSRPGFGAYKASKSALRSLAGSLATELGPRGVRVNTVVPNYIWTEGLKGWFAVQAAERGWRWRTCTPRRRPRSTCVACPSPAMSPTRCCGWPRTSPGRSPGRASTSTRASSTADPALALRPRTAPPDPPGGAVRGRAGAGTVTARSPRWTA